MILLVLKTINQIRWKLLIMGNNCKKMTKQLQEGMSHLASPDTYIKYAIQTSIRTCISIIGRSIAMLQDQWYY